MKGYLHIFILLLVSQIFVAPVCFGLQINEVKDPSATFEQIRLKKRRSIFIEEAYVFEAAFGIVAVIVTVQRMRLKAGQAQSFLRPFLHFFDLPLITYPLLSPAVATSLFLRNRVLRL